jgi:drug/metabolite transporter (DMT)-like permease
MPSTELIGNLFALASAFVWGSGDFSGGLATRRANQFQVLAVSTLAGLVGLVVLAAVYREPFPSAENAVWAVSAGLAGALGIASLYQALSLGQAANVAPTAAVIGVAMLALYGAVTEGWPGWIRMLGFILAIAGIWLVSQSAETGGRAERQALGLALLAGLGFGGFFILIGRVESGLVFTPLIFARSASLGVAVVLMLARRVSLPTLASSPIAILAGLLDTGGNVLYLVAKQFTRLDVAGVLASLYPVSTVLLAWLLLKQKVSPLQWLGAALCMVAVVLITL